MLTVEASEASKKLGRPKQNLSPEQEAERQERRRRQLAAAQARRRARLVGALEQVEMASQTSQEIQDLRAQVKSLQSSVASQKDRQTTLERAYVQLEEENKKLRNKKAGGPANASRSPAPMAGRVEAIVQEITTYGGSGTEKDFLEGYVSLAKKWATDTKGTATKVETILAVTTGRRAIEGKGFAASRFASPILSEEENRIITQAMLVLNRIASDVDSAAHKVAALHKQREAERVERAKKANQAMVIFDKLCVDDKIMLIAMQYKRHNTGWGPFHDLVQGLNRPDSRDRWWKASKHLEEAYKERRGNLVQDAARAMKASGRSATDLAGDAFQKFLDSKPIIEAEWPDLVNKIKVQIVVEQLEKSNQSS